MKKNSNDKDDLRLVGLAKNGDIEGFETLFDNYHRMVYAVSYKLCGNRAEAEDIMQETFIRVARSIQSFRGDSKFSSWLYRITFNVASDFRLKRKRDAKLQEEFTEYQKLDQASEENVNDILIALQCLSKEERDAVVLVIYEEMKHGEAAKILGCAETTVSWRIFNAKKKLRNYFKKQDAL